MVSTPELWLIYATWYANWALERARDELLAVFGITYATPLTYLAILSLIFAVFIAVLAIAILLQSISAAARTEPVCPHGVRGAKTGKGFCPTCARDQSIVDELQNRLRKNRAR
jgi:hypothetical protein